MEKVLLFTLKMKFLPKNLTRLYKFGDKNWSLVPQNVHLVPKNGKICTFYTKNEVFAQTFDKKLGKKTGVWYPKMYIWSLKMENFLLFTLKMKFMPNCTNWG